MNVAKILRTVEITSGYHRETTAATKKKGKMHDFIGFNDNGSQFRDDHKELGVSTRQVSGVESVLEISQKQG